MSTLRPLTVSQRLAAFTHGLRFEDLPADVVEQAKDRLLDSLSTGIAAHGLPVPNVAMAIALGNQGPATIIGAAGGYPIVDAALVNATLINGRTQDDFLAKSHPGAVVVPAALAVGEAEGASGRDFLTALVIGYDVVARAYLGGPGMLPRFRATGVAGCIGAAAAAAKLLRLDAEQTADALGCSAVFAAGIGAGFLTGTMDVKLNVGMASRNGATAALMARAGATASPLEFEGEAGFYKAVANTAEYAERTVHGLGEHFLIADTIYKEYPVCIFVQTPVTLARGLAEQLGRAVAEIEKVTVTVSDLTYTNPGFTNVAPFASALNARVSARFCIAAALLGRPIDEYEYYSNYTDADVLALADKIDLVLDPVRADIVDVEIRTALGKVVSARGGEGETLHPTRQKIAGKFTRITGTLLGTRGERILEMVHKLDTLENIGTLAQLLRANREPGGAAIVSEAAQ
ncbi:MmgE/PrpD family protein [Roseixanthobacter pseudopolyaromaticivorans]|uniref:MmgE/PrpD family protein n=1 Tax=Xanthobacteraceae TaxID=335928 RepID=UPI00372A7FFE